VAIKWQNSDEQRMVAREQRTVPCRMGGCLPYEEPERGQVTVGGRSGWSNRLEASRHRISGKTGFSRLHRVHVKF
jgi:hypothetical protein